ncbi:hypothetical protein [Corynebacterium lipophiloflavum]|uniref:Uncharacterized protein n=1 Tax=Corynebacterium lipophiloflavum (strain ATCC 700352 / DSM 44291 / CCUG 37336 / JCM 10383 / DMMZ 1944) TaxID=525263 RepID=C0XTY6_CORLD|nr:hypothetical protein [Corynebacterium lipophiloflavum]EEI16320.1 hypothetical protein HMPREF0298_1906 [Corynebacterium lipophiloflavum DSM 44291]
MTAPSSLSEPFWDPCALNFSRENREHLRSEIESHVCDLLANYPANFTDVEPWLERRAALIEVDRQEDGALQEWLRDRACKRQQK